MIDTRKVQGRRTLAFASLQDAVSEAQRLAALEREGRLRALGNWPLGTSLNHIAAWAEYPFDGFAPEVANPPWFVKWPIRLMKSKLMTKPLPVGMRIPGIEAGTTAVEQTPTAPALARLERAMDRLERTAPTMPNPVLGPLTHEEWKTMHRKHAEHHLGFYVETSE